MIYFRRIVLGLFSVSLLALIVWNVVVKNHRLSHTSLEESLQSLSNNCALCKHALASNDLRSENSLGVCAICRLSIKKKFSKYFPALHSQALSQVFEEDPREFLSNDIVGLNLHEDATSASISGSDDGFMDASELPAHTIKQSVLDYCMSRFPVRRPHFQGNISIVTFLYLFALTSHDTQIS